MRILALTNLYPSPSLPHRGPFNRQQLQALGKRHEIRVISPVAWTDELGAHWGRGRARSVAPLRTSDASVSHPTYVYPPKILRSWYGRFYQSSVRRTFARALAEFRPEIIFAAWAYPDGWAAVQFGRRANIPVVIKIHGSDVLTLPSVAGRGARTAEALRDCDAVIAVSKDLAQRAIRMGASSHTVSVVYDGIDPDLFKPGSRDAARSEIGVRCSDPIILFVGNLIPVKGLDMLIDACSLLKARGVKYQCRLVGQGRLRPDLERQVERAGLSEQLKFVGPVEHSSLPNWFRAANVFVLPSRSEGVPCVLLEAAACRIPCVATRVGGIPEVVGINRTRLVPAGNAAALADALADELLTADSSSAPDAFCRSHDDAARDIEVVLNRVLSTSRSNR